MKRGITALAEQEGIETLVGSEMEGAQGAPIRKTTAEQFLTHKDWEEEVFGPSTLSVMAKDKDQLMEAAKSLKGHLTATLFANEDDLANYHDSLSLFWNARLVVW